jgi:hypothetical protein
MPEALVKNANNNSAVTARPMLEKIFIALWYQ